MAPLELTTVVASVAVRSALALIRERIDNEAPPIDQGGDGSSLAPPDRRLSSGVSFDDDRPIPTLFVEREGGWGQAKAEEVAESLPGNTNVVVRGTGQSLWPRQPVSSRRGAPVRVGASVSNYRGSAGTLTCLVTDSESGQLGFVSAGHVMSMLNRAKTGDAPHGDPIIRPGNPDGPKSTRNRIGYLREFVYLSHHDDELADVALDNSEDVALGLFDKDVGCDELNLVPDPKDPASLRRVSPSPPLEDLVRQYGSQRVFKVGRTTKLTAGRLVGIETGRCPIMLPDRRIYIFSGLILIEREKRAPFSSDGDSGALVYTEDFKALGIVIAGNDRYSWASPIDACLEAVGAKLLT
ncbi:MAG TPA: hypothetical protein VFY36_03990 [Solirubrobacteraceae bacterium]|nr:hypothetical protein [Solirubrobacteraceae bacterium]